MSTSIEVIGVYAIEAQEPVHLVELMVRECRGRFDIGEITQEDPDQPRSNWQVPYDERILSHDGESVVADPFLRQDKPEDWIGEVRISFFFHYLDMGSVLITPFGNVELPEASPKPDRLSFLEYESP